LKIGLFYFCGWQMGGKSTELPHFKSANQLIS